MKKKESEQEKAAEEEAEAAQAEQRTQQAQEAAADAVRREAQEAAAESAHTSDDLDKAINDVMKGSGGGSSPAGSGGNGLASLTFGAGSGGSKIAIFFVIVFVTNIIDMLGQYNRIGGSGTFWALWYFIIAFLLAPMLLDKGWPRSIIKKDTIFYAIISVVSWFWPWLTKIIPDVMYNSKIANGFLAWFFVFTSPWILFLLFSKGDSSKMTRVYRALWLGFLVIVLLVVAAAGIVNFNIPTGLQASSSFDVRDGLGDLWDTLTSSLSKVGKSLFGIGPRLGTFVKVQLNDSVGWGFSGQVDPYSTKDMGVRFQNTHVIASEFRQGQDVVVWTDIQGESFKNQINLSLRCYAVDKKGNIQDGVIQTQGRLNSNVVIKMKERVSASCTLSNLSEGYYDVVFAGLFNFETWAYIQYYFAPDEMVKDLWMQDKDPAREAGIDSRPSAIYTNGPVMLGLSSEQDQPIGVDEVDPQRSLPIYGASLTNQWTDGAISSVQFVDLLVPEPFLLERCDRTEESSGSKEVPSFVIDEDTGYRRYRFGNYDDTLGNFVFESVTCFLNVDGSNGEEQRMVVAEELLGGYHLVLKTFAGRTSYLYTIHDSVRVEVG